MSSSSNNVTTSTHLSRSSAKTQLRQGDIKLVLTATALAALMNELGNHPLDQLENECRQLIRRTVAAAIELGKRLLIIKNSVAHGLWLETVERIGSESSVARRFMQAATRFINLGGLPALASAIDSQTKLFELLPLDDDELVALDAGQTVRGVSAETLPAMTVKALRTTLRNQPPATPSPAVQCPEVAPILGAAPILGEQSEAATDDSDGRGLTLEEALKDLDDLHYDIDTMLGLAESQVKAISELMIEGDSKRMASHYVPLLDIAAKLFEPYEVLMDRFDNLTGVIRDRIFRDPEAGAILPQSVWLSLVRVIASDHPGGYSNDEMGDLARTVESMARYGNSPEVVAAVRLMEDYAKRQGAYLYDHEPSGRLAFAWNDGRPRLHRRAGQVVTMN